MRTFADPLIMGQRRAYLPTVIKQAKYPEDYDEPTIIEPLVK